MLLLSVCAEALRKSTTNIYFPAEINKISFFWTNMSYLELWHKGGFTMLRVILHKMEFHMKNSVRKIVISGTKNSKHHHHLDNSISIPE